MVHCYCRSGEGALRARMFCPGDGEGEDAATGSANGALMGLLASLDGFPNNGTVTLLVTQGCEMGRPSTIYVSADRKNGATTAIHIGGAVTKTIMKGEIDLSDIYTSPKPLPRE